MINFRLQSKPKKETTKPFHRWCNNFGKTTQGHSEETNIILFVLYMKSYLIENVLYLKVKHY